MSADLAKKLFQAMTVNAQNVPVGGGIVMKKTQDVRCTAATIAAPGGQPSTTYSCLALSGSDAQQIMAFLAGESHSTAGGGGVVISKTSTVKCTAATSGSPAGGQAGATTYSCANVQPQEDASATEQGSESILDGVANLRRIGNVSQIVQSTPGTLALSFMYRSCEELEFRGEAAEVGSVIFVKVIQVSQETCRGPERDIQGHAKLQRTGDSIVSVLNPLLLPNQAVPSLP